MKFPFFINKSGNFLAERHPVFSEFVAWIETNGLPDLISFDHDLGLTELPECKEQNGLTCAKWLVNYCLDNELPLPECVVHSQNPVGRENIEGLLCQFRRLGNL